MMKYRFKDSSILAQVSMILFFLIISCTNLEFENNTRLLVRGMVVDEFRNPIPNISVEIYATADEVSFLPPQGTESVIIGFSKTDAVGNFEIISLSPINDLFTSVSINTMGDNNKRDNLEYSTISISLAEFNQEENNRFTFPQPIILNNIN